MQLFSSVFDLDLDDHIFKAQIKSKLRIQFFIKNLSHILAVSGAWNDTFLAFSGPWNQEKPFWSFQGPEMKLFWHFQGPEMAPFWLFQAPEIRWSLFGVIRGLKLSYFGIFRGLKWHLIGWKRWYSEIILTQLTNRFIANCWTYPGP